MNEQVIEVRAQGQTGWTSPSEPVGGRRTLRLTQLKGCAPWLAFREAPKEDVEEALKYAP
jgi:hypothetical protein